MRGYEGGGGGGGRKFCRRSLSVCGCGRYCGDKLRFDCAVAHATDAKRAAAAVIKSFFIVSSCYVRVRLSCPCLVKQLLNQICHDCSRYEGRHADLR